MPPAMLTYREGEPLAHLSKALGACLCGWLPHVLSVGLPCGAASLRGWWGLLPLPCVGLTPLSLAVALQLTATP